MPSVTLVAFDLDGTLVDSVADLAQALGGFLARHGHDPVTVGELRGMMGDGARELIERAIQARGRTIAPELAQAMATDFLAEYDHYPHTASTLFPAVGETLDQLRQSGMALAVVTNKRELPARRLLAHLGIADRFDTLVGGDTTPEAKPSPLPLQAAMAACGASAATTIMVGDSINDIVMAKRVGAFSIGCRYGFPRLPADLDGADILIDSMAELPMAIRRLLPRSRDRIPRP